MHGETLPSRILMLGGGGLLLELARELPPDTQIEVRFQPAHHLPVVEVTARVRYQFPNLGTGVEFVTIKPEDRQVILRIIIRRITERPRYSRRKFVTRVERDEGIFLGFSRDISVGGMFIETKTPFPEGYALKLRFHLDDGGPELVVEAEVCYMVMNLCMGIEFVDLSPSDRARIETYVGKAEGGV